jgi:hypothetical protein
VADPIEQARQLMTITLVLSPSSITASVRRRYLTGTGHPPPTATVSAAFGWQNPEHRLPDHCADRIQGSQNQRPAGHSTLLPVWNRQIRSSPGAKSPWIDTTAAASSPAVSSLEAFRTSAAVFPSRQ